MPQGRQNQTDSALVWFPDPSLKLRAGTRGRVWANDLPFGVAEHCIPL